MPERQRLSIKRSKPRKERMSGRSTTSSISHILHTCPFKKRGLGGCTKTKSPNPLGVGQIPHCGAHMMVCPCDGHVIMKESALLDPRFKGGEEYYICVACKAAMKSKVEKMIVEGVDFKRDGGISICCERSGWRTCKCDRDGGCNEPRQAGCPCPSCVAWWDDQKKKDPGVASCCRFAGFTVEGLGKFE